MITYLFNKLPAVRRLRATISSQESDINLHGLRLRQCQEDLRSSRNAVGDLTEELDHVKKKRNELHRQVDEMGTTIIKQAATIDGMQLVRNHAETLINEQKLIIADLRSREERWHNTVQALNSSLLDRNAVLGDLRAELTEAQEALEKRSRVVRFALKGEYADDVLDEILAGKGNQKEVKALIQLLDACAVEAMDESATPPLAPITDGPHAARGFTEENRTFSTGGVYVLTEFKRRLLEKVEAVLPERKAA